MSEEGLKEAQKLFSCQKAKCAEFSCTDPFNEKVNNSKTHSRIL